MSCPKLCSSVFADTPSPYSWEHYPAEAITVFTLLYMHLVLSLRIRGM